MKKTSENVVYQIVTLPVSRKSLKKLPTSVRKRLIESLQLLKTNPYHGEQLTGEWRLFRSFHFKHENVQYRVVYEVNEKEKLIIVRYAASRENFYRELRNLKLKPLAA